MIERKALMNPCTSNVVLSKPAERKEKYANREYDQLITTLNPVADIHGSFQLTGLYVDRIYNKIEKLTDDLKNSNDTTRRIGQRMEGVQTDLKEMLDTR
jgi:hypothetical protein